MISQEILIDEAAGYKKDSKSYFDEALAALLALAWPYRSADFSFDGDDELYQEALDICISLSDKCNDRAIARMKNAISGMEGVDAWIGENEYENIGSFDMAGTHLLELLGVWISVAAKNNWTEGYTRVMITRYISNPFLCPAWKEVPLDTLSWGRGYAKNIPEQLALIGQDMIIGGARWVEWNDEATNKNATYYIRRRGSTYDCPECDSWAGIPIPIETPFEPSHARCCCFPEYHYDNIPV